MSVNHQTNHLTLCCKHNQWIDYLMKPFYSHIKSIRNSFVYRDILKMDTKYITIITTVKKQGFNIYSFFSFSFFSEENGEYKTQNELITKMHKNLTTNIHENDLILEYDLDSTCFSLDTLNRKEMSFIHFKSIYHTIDELENFLF